MKPRPLADLTETGWLWEDRPPLLSAEDPAWTGNLVSHCLPDQYEAFVKILHPIYADESVDSRSRSWAAEDELRSTLGRLASVGSGPEPPGPRVTWQQLAHQQGLAFHSEINERSIAESFPDRSMPRYLAGPTEGSLDRPTCGALVAALAESTGEEDCFFYYAEVATQRVEPLLFGGNLTDVFSFFDNRSVFGTPTYWWPRSRSWCVCTDWDLCFTLVGGPAFTTEALYASQVLETLSVSASSRIDWWSDGVNRHAAT